MCICVRFVISDRSIRCWWRSHHMKNKTPFSVVKFQCSCAEPSSPSSLFARNIFFIFLVYKIFLQLQMIIFGLWFCDHTKHMRNFDRSKFLFNNSARWHMKYFAHSCVSWHFVMLNGVVIRLTQPIMVSVRENAIYAFVYSTVSRRRYRADSIAACFVFFFFCFVRRFDKKQKQTKKYHIQKYVHSLCVSICSYRTWDIRQPALNHAQLIVFNCIQI